MTFDKISIGTDPEVFLFDTKKQEFITAEGIIPGTKDNPHKITDKGHNIQLDNVLAEINVPPSKRPKQMMNDINFVMSYIKLIIPEDVVISVVPSAELKDEYLKSKHANIFGCEPDYNAWTFNVNPPPNPSRNLRTAGGHIHVGYADPDTLKSVEIIRTMDVFLGLPSIFLDKDNTRREMYGKAGAFRLCNYGVEYRTLSNFWIKKQTLVTWVFESVQKVIDFLNEGNSIEEADGEDIQKAINTNDKKLALQIADKYKVTITERKPAINKVTIKI